MGRASKCLCHIIITVLICVEKQLKFIFYFGLSRREKKTMRKQFSYNKPVMPQMHFPVQRSVLYQGLTAFFKHTLWMTCVQISAFLSPQLWISVNAFRLSIKSSKYNLGLYLTLCTSLLPCARSSAPADSIGKRGFDWSRWCSPRVPSTPPIWHASTLCSSPRSEWRSASWILLVSKLVFSEHPTGGSGGS